MSIAHKAILIMILHFAGCHAVKSDYIGKTNGTSFYHLMVRSIIYTLPFIFYYGLDARSGFMLAVHYLLDWLETDGIFTNTFLSEFYHIFAAGVAYVVA